MSITNYGALKTAIANWLDRTDLTSYIPDFITNAEATIAYGNAGDLQSDPLRIRAMETSTDVTISAQTAALPTGFVAARRLYLNTNPIAQLNYYTPEAFWDRFIFSTAGKPYGFTLEGDNFVFGPTPDGTYTGKLLYYKKFTALSADSDTNWLLTNAPKVYLYGALVESAPFLKDDGRIATWFSLYQAAVNGVSRSDTMDRHTGSALVTRSDVVVDAFRR